MDDKNKNPIENSQNFSAGQSPQPVNPVPAQTPVAAPPPPSQESNSSMPTPPKPSSGGKGSTIIVGGILLLFVIIVVALYFLILRQNYEPQVQITPPPAQNINETVNESLSPTPVNAEEEEVVEIDLEENIEEDFAPIYQGLNQL